MQVRPTDDQGGRIWNPGKIRGRIWTNRGVGFRKLLWPKYLLLCRRHLLWKSFSRARPPYCRRYRENSSPERDTLVIRASSEKSGTSPSRLSQLRRVPAFVFESFHTQHGRQEGSPQDGPGHKPTPGGNEQGADDDAPRSARSARSPAPLPPRSHSPPLSTSDQLVPSR